MAGLGIAARQVLPSFQQVEGTALTAVADVRGDELARFRETYGVATFDSVQAMCESDLVDAVWIATPNTLHKEHTVLAATNGKHVICEKPMALSLAECDEMIEAVERNGLKYVQGHSKIYNSPIRLMRQVIASGELGRVIQINSWNYNDWLLRPRLASEVDTTKGGGLVYRQGPHQVDIVRYLGGGTVRSVRGAAGRADPSFQTEGHFSAFLTFENRAVATLSLNGYGHFNVVELTWYIGESGKPVPDEQVLGKRHRPNGPIDPSTKYSLPRYAEHGHGPRQRERQPFFGLTVVACERGVIRQSPDGVFVYTDDGQREVRVSEATEHGELAELKASLAEDRPSFPDARWGKATLEVCLAILESSNSQREITLAHQVPVPDSAVPPLRP